MADALVVYGHLLMALINTRIAFTPATHFDTGGQVMINRMHYFLVPNLLKQQWIRRVKTHSSIQKRLGVLLHLDNVVVVVVAVILLTLTELVINGCGGALHLQLLTIRFSFHVCRLEL